MLISRYIHPGTVSDQPYNHYSWLRSMEDLYGVTAGGTDGHGHIGYAGMNGLRPFGPDVYNNPGGVASPPPPALGAGGLYPAVQGAVADEPPAMSPVPFR